MAAIMHTQRHSSISPRWGASGGEGEQQDDVL